VLAIIGFVMEESSFALRPSLPLWLLILAGALLLALSIASYAHTLKQLGSAPKALLVGLRTCAILLLLVCLLRPGITTTSYTTERRPLVFLIDQSRSMSHIHDTVGGSSRLEALNEALERNASRMEALKERYELITLPFAGKLLGKDEVEGAPSRGFSAYGRAMQQAFEEVVQRDCEAMVVFGDGCHNLGPPDPMDVAAMLSERGIPLYTVGVGREEATRQLRDIKVLEIRAPEEALVFTRFTVRGNILFRGCRGVEALVRAEFNGEVIEGRKVRVAHDEEVVPVQFEVCPQDIGEYKVAVRAERINGEILRENNAMWDYVRVVRGGFRVALFDRPRPESRFVGLALRGGEHINFQKMLTAGRRTFTNEQTDWNRYEVVILGDVDASSLKATAVTRLKDAVLEGGKGLIMLAGPNSAGKRGLGASPLAEVLPVVFDEESAVLEGEQRFLIEEAYAGHPVLAIGAEGASVEELWRHLPPLATVITGARPKRGAEVLARDQAGNPLLVIQRAGKGRTVCILSDTTFRWYFTEADTQEAYKRFWRQVVLWAGGGEKKQKQQFRIELSEKRVQPEQKVVILVRALDAEGVPIRDASISLLVVAPDGSSERPAYTFSRSEGAFRADYAPPGSGEYTVRAEGSRAGEPIGEDIEHFLASTEDRELEDPVANLKLLRRLSATTAQWGGSYYLHSNVHRLFDALLERGKPPRLAARKWKELWDTPWLLLLFLLCIGTEWGVRKWKGLV